MSAALPATGYAALPPVRQVDPRGSRIRDRIVRRLLRLSVRLTEFAEGVDWGFPLCCVLRFSFHRSDHRQALLRGVRHLPISQRRAADGCGSYVPCLWFHKAEERV